jgi:hypothetical protein
MTSTTLSVLPVRATAEPRGALLVGLLYSAFQALFRSTPARMPSRTEEAAQVREMARQVQFSDPGFAADLMAAADRHESLDDTSFASVR